jgi:hypothetical protein
VGPAVTPSAHLPRRPQNHAPPTISPLLSPLPSAKPVATRRPSPPRELDAVHVGKGSQRRHRTIASPPPSPTRVAPPPELGPRAPTRASGLAATRRAAMRCHHGRRGQRWPTAARANLSPREILDPPPSRAAFKRSCRSTRTIFPLSAFCHCVAAMELARLSFAAAG